MQNCSLHGGHSAVTTQQSDWGQKNKKKSSLGPVSGSILHSIVTGVTGVNVREKSFWRKEIEL